MPRHLDPNGDLVDPDIIADDDNENERKELEADARAERRRANRYRCSDGMCGADDCPRCRG